MADVVQQSWQRYLYCLQRYPLRTKALTAGVLAGSSDCLAQKLAGAKSLQFRRVFFMALYGLLYAGPFGHFFHKLMDRIFAGKKDGTTVVKKTFSSMHTRTGPQQSTVVGLVHEIFYFLENRGELVVVEQLTSNPWNNLIYMCYLGLVLEGRTWSTLKSKIRSDYPNVQLNSWKFWPIVGLLNYKFMPQHLRVLFGNLAAVCWANYLKWRVLYGGGRGTFLILRSGSAAPALKKGL